MFCAGAHFCGAISILWPYLLDLHEKKSRTVLKILPWNLKFISIYKHVVVNTFNGFVILILINLFLILHKKSHYFSSKFPCELYYCRVEFRAVYERPTQGKQRRQRDRDDRTPNETKIFQNSQIMQFETISFLVSH